jgi:hypothetical protein
MPFVKLDLDPRAIAPMLYFNCRNPKCTDPNTMCGQCNQAKDLVKQTFFTPYSSIVMVPTYLQEYFFRTGPVSYFYVLAGYYTLFKYIHAMCNPDSKLNPDKEWNAGARPARVLAQKMLVHFGPFMKKVITYAVRDQNKPEMLAENRLRYLQAVETQLSLLIAIMEEVPTLSPAIVRNVKANFKKRKADYVTQNIIEWTWGERCGRDHLKDQRAENERWNEDHAEYQIIIAEQKAKEEQEALEKKEGPVTAEPVVEAVEEEEEVPMAQAVEEDEKEEDPGYPKWEEEKSNPQSP